MKKLEITIRDPNKPEDTKKLTYFNIFRSGLKATKIEEEGSKNEKG